MQCPLCGYYMASLDTECLRCHGQGLTGINPKGADANPDVTPDSTLPGAPAPLVNAAPPRFVPPHAVPQPGGANARANDSLRNDSVLEELSRNPRRVALDGSQGLSFGAIFVLFFVVFIVLPWGCTKIFMPTPQKLPPSSLTPQNTKQAGRGAALDTKTQRGVSDSDEESSTSSRDVEQTSDQSEARP